MEFILDNFANLLYIVIVIVAIASSLWSKKGKPAEEDEAPPAPPVPQPSTRRPAQQPRPQPMPANEDLRKTLDDIFSSKETAAYDSRRTTYESQRSTHDSRKAVTPGTRANAQPQTVKRLARSAITPDDMEWEKALMERAVKDAARAAAKAEAAGIEDLHASIDERELLTQARNGVIWSEILLPPVSMR